MSTTSVLKEQRTRDVLSERRPILTAMFAPKSVKGSDPRDNQRAFRQCPGFVERELGRPGEIFDGNTAAEQNPSPSTCSNGDQNRRRNQ